MLLSQEQELFTDTGSVSSKENIEWRVDLDTTKESGSILKNNKLADCLPSFCHVTTCLHF